MKQTKLLAFTLLMFLVVFIPKALAVGESCDTQASECCTPPPVVVVGGGCDTGEYWIGDASTGYCRTSSTTCGTVGDITQSFSCVSGGCTFQPKSTSTPSNPLCGGDSSKIHLGGDDVNNCASKVTVIQDPTTATILKTWLGQILGRLVYVGDTDCVTGQAPVWNNTTKKWVCGSAEGLWLATGTAPNQSITSNASDYKGGVVIKKASPDTIPTVDIEGGTWNPVDREGDLRIGNSTYRLKIGVALAGSGAGDSYLNSMGGTNRMLLGGGGNNTLTLISDKVGINTITPTQALDVDKGDALVQGTGSFDAAAETASVFLGDTNNWVRSTLGGKSEIGGWNGVRFMARDTGDGVYKEAMTIKPYANWNAIGINKTDPGSLLDIGFNGSGLYGSIINLNQTAVGNSDGPKIGFIKKISLSPDTTSFWTAGILNGANVQDFGISENAGVIGFGSSRLTIKSGGNVGIGTTTPAGTLDVNGDIYLKGLKAISGEANGWLRINQDNAFPNGTHFANRANFYKGITTGDWWSVEPGVGNILVNGSVGIGTTTPGVKLEVNGSVRGNVAGALRIDSGNGYVDVGPQNTGWAHFSTDRDNFWFNKSVHVNGAISSYDTNDLNLQTGGITRINVLKSTGRVSIGDAGLNYSPWYDWNYTLLLNASDTSSIGFHDAGHSVGQITYSGSWFTIGGNGGWGNANVSMPGSVSIGGSIDLGGDLDVNGYIRRNGGYPLHFGSLGASNGMWPGTEDAGFSLTWNLTGGGGEVDMVTDNRDSSGNTIGWAGGLLITDTLKGTSAVANDDYVWLRSDGKIESRGIAGASDERLKKDITQIDPPLENIMKLRGVNFNWKSEPDGPKQYGLIAQEVEKIFPEVVESQKTGSGLKSIYYDQLIPILIEGMKEQNALITGQQRTIESLSLRLTGLESKIK